MRGYSVVQVKKIGLEYLPETRLLSNKSDKV